MRFLFYSHDGMGLGHVRRHLAIASALVGLRPDAKVLLVTSVDEVSRLGLPPNVDTLKLPGLRKVANCHYASRRLGLRTVDIQNLRSTLLGGTVAAFEPHVILVDKHPLGAGGELADALVAAKAARGHLILGLRDVLDEPAAVLREWIGEGLHEVVTKVYDQILVYGDQEIFDPVQQYCFSKDLARRTSFCGYVLNEARGDTEQEAPQFPDSETGRLRVLGTTGGGEDGFQLLKTFIEASRGAAWEGVVVAGPMLAEPQLRVLEELAAAERVRLFRFIPSLPAVFQQVGVLVSMGGYNTLLEALAAGVPTVCVPRVQPRLEQLIRAQRFANLGLLTMLRPEQLTAEALRAAIDSGLTRDRRQILQRSRTSLTFNGALRAAQYLLAHASSENREHRVRISQVGA